MPSKEKVRSGTVSGRQMGVSEGEAIFDNGCSLSIAGGGEGEGKVGKEVYGRGSREETQSVIRSSTQPRVAPQDL